MGGEQITEGASRRNKLRDRATHRRWAYLRLNSHGSSLGHMHAGYTNRLDRQFLPVEPGELGSHDPTLQSHYLVLIESPRPLGRSWGTVLLRPRLAEEEQRRYQIQEEALREVHLQE